jgi:hypothetical protein
MEETGVTALVIKAATLKDALRNTMSDDGTTTILQARLHVRPLSNVSSDS